MYQVVHSHTKHKRKKYLSLLAIMLMMGGSIGGLMSSDSITYAKKKAEITNSYGMPSGRNYSSSWRKLGKKNISTSSKKGWMLASRHDYDGYLIPVGKNKKGKKPVRSVKVFGPKKYWSKVTDNSGYMLDKMQVQRDHATSKVKGKTGAYYKNWFFFVDKDFKHKKPVSVKITLMKWATANHGTNYGIDIFHMNPSVSCQGEGDDGFKVEFFDSKGKPLNKRFPYTFWDVDDGQVITFGRDTFKNVKNFYHSPQTFIKYDAKSKSFLGKPSDLKLPEKAGSVTGLDPRGSISASVLGPTLEFTFSRGSEHKNLFNQRSQSKSSTVPKNLYRPTKKRKLSEYSSFTDIDGHATFGNYFEMSPSKVNLPPLIPSKKPKKYVGKYNFTSHYKDSDWVKKIKIEKPNSTFYYNIRSIINSPAGVDGVKGIEDFEIADSHIDKGLDIKSVHVYKQQTSNTKGKRVDKLFSGTGKPKGHKVLVKLKDEWKKAKHTGKYSFFNGIFNVVIEVKPNKKFSYPKREGLKFTGMASNTAQYNWVWIPHGKNKWNDAGGSVTATLTKGGKGHPVKDKPGVGQTTKDVFKKGNGTSGNSDFDLSHSWDKGTVAPGQWLKYRVWFNVPKLPSNTDTHEYKYFKGEITDKLDPNLDASSVTKAHVYFNGQRTDATPGATVKGDLKHFLKQMRSGGKAMLEFEVKV